MYSFFSKIDIKECENRIRNSVCNNFFAKDKLSGRVNSNKHKFWLLKHKANLNNSFARIFYGRMTSEDNGTIIKGSFHLHLLVKIFILIWFGGLIVIGGYIFLLSILQIILSTSYNIVNPVAGILAPCGFLMFGIFLTRLGKWLSKDGEEYVLKFIIATLEAKQL